MREVNTVIEAYRIRTGPAASDASFGNNGAFNIPCGSVMLRVLASDDNTGMDWGWEHVSVSLRDRCPTWEEMCAVKELFWRSDELVVQFHPPKAAYINNHPTCLHLWKPLRQTIELPPAWMIGVQGLSPEEVRQDVKGMYQRAEEAAVKAMTQGKK